MTGHGEGASRKDALAASVEVRTVNNRYLKVTVRGVEGYIGLESQIEDAVRQKIQRGAVHVQLRLDRQASPDDFPLNHTALTSYVQQVEEIYRSLHIDEPVRVEALLALPGVVDESAALFRCRKEDWPVIQEALRQALENTERMRRDEGRAMADDLRTNCRLIGEQLDEIERRAPEVSQLYYGRLSERVKKLLDEHAVDLNEAELARETALFAERSDISEEIVRLRSHLEQFTAFLSSDESCGRKLDFLTQEMFREANTIGAKANDTQIPRRVIEIKAAIERMREMIQNVE